jgi:iron complex outermembrane recepter protein
MTANERCRLATSRLTGLLLAAGCACAAHAQSGDVALEPVVVTGTLREQAALDAPFAISTVDAQTLRSAGPMINLSEAMARVPGLVVNNRNNYAQDLQISSRGFGARAGFGVRGVRLYTDGIPASMPDGQGQVGHFDLAGTQRVEVLRGPFSVLYGNSSGGVIATVSAPVREVGGEGAFDAGSFGLRQIRAGIAVPSGSGWDLQLRGAQMDIRGFRPRSEASRLIGSARLGWRGDSDRVVVLANVQDQPAQDPLGLRREDFDANPDQTASQATRFDTRKTAEQSQLGARWQHFFGDDGGLRETSLAAYAGQRSVVQFLAIEPGTQANQRHGGGVIDFDRNYHGVHARARFGWDALDLVLGAEVERQQDDRRGFENFVGTGPAQVLGVIGNPRRAETNTATTTDAYAQASVPVGASLTASAGVRGGRVRMSAKDAFLSNGDDSGNLKFSYANPVVGLAYKPTPRLNLHASAARGFESPTLGELAYRPDGTGGFNVDLKPQKSRQFEIGAKWRGDAVDLDAAVFRANTDDEIGIATNAGGRSSFQNVGRTQRTGAELAAGLKLGASWRARLSLTWLDATYRDGFITCAGIPCTLPTPAQPAGQNLARVPAGNRIAGTQDKSAYAELAWKAMPTTELAAEWRASGRVPVNDLNGDFAAGYGVVNLRAVQRYALGGGQTLELLLRIDNVADQRYAGSVIVNDANGRYFEPAAPRSVLLGLRLSTGL